MVRQTIRVSTAVLVLAIATGAFAVTATGQQTTTAQQTTPQAGHEA